MTALKKYFAATLVRSGAGRQKTQRLTLTALGLTRLRRTRYFQDTPATRGMLYKVVHLIHLVVHEGDLPLSARAKTRQYKAALQKRGEHHAIAP
jgi:large subunit ribosomal protein L30